MSTREEPEDYPALVVEILSQGHADVYAFGPRPDPWYLAGFFIALRAAFLDGADVNIRRIYVAPPVVDLPAHGAKCGSAEDRPCREDRHLGQILDLVRRIPPRTDHP